MKKGIDGRPSRESIPDIDFLNENLVVTFELASEAVGHLPQVSDADAETGTERYAALLGTYTPDGQGKVGLQIKGVYQESQEELTKYGSYREGIETVTIYPKLLKERIATIQRDHAKYKDFHFLGDIHTHPASGIPKPSTVDLESVVQRYLSGDLAPNKPYVFGIGAKRSDGEMEYWFYRLIKTDSASGYGYKELDHIS